MPDAAPAPSAAPPIAPPITPSATTPDRTASAAPTGPSVHRRALITWLAVYPTITLALGLLGPATSDLPLPLRTLILTAVVVPVAAYALIPLLMRADAAAGRRARGAIRPIA
ncbi:hypothetical protein ACIQWR_10615 [Streptomyces sp. NPDC098789]|uniref:hypothetical protein n=1 Tax=Streptomyces sp. NPDC098789 TaxID=3366098 RepID=UPI0037F757C9